MGPRACDFIETIRVAWERALERLTATMPPSRDPYVDPGEDDPRHLLDETMATRVHALARATADRLGFTDPFVLYQTPRAEHHVNAQALVHDRPFAIRLIGPVARCLDDEALTALLGHEFGHALALGPLANPRSTVLEAWDRACPTAHRLMSNVAAELTAERFAVLAAGSLEAVVRLEVANLTWDSPQRLGVLEEEYLAETCSRVEQRSTPLFNGLWPSPALRMFADWLFYRSDVHRELTGRGPGELSLRDVDAQLRVLCESAAPAEPAPTPALERAKPRSNQPPAEGRDPIDWATKAQSTARTVRRAWHSIVNGLPDRSVVEPRPQADDVPALDDEAAREALLELDDVEQRFRELERAADAAAGKPGKQGS